RQAGGGGLAETASRRRHSWSASHSRCGMPTPATARASSLVARSSPPARVRLPRTTQLACLGRRMSRTLKTAARVGTGAAAGSSLRGSLARTGLQLLEAVRPDHVGSAVRVGESEPVKALRARYPRVDSPSPRLP